MTDKTNYIGKYVCDGCGLEMDPDEAFYDYIDDAGDERHHCPGCKYNGDVDLESCMECGAFKELFRADSDTLLCKKCINKLMK